MRRRPRNRAGARVLNILATLRRPRVAVPLLLLLAVLVFVGLRAASRSSGERWARKTALPEIRRLIDAGERDAAYALALEAEARIPGDVGLEELFAAVSERIDVVTEPPGAEVWVQPYAEPESEWRRVGTTPLDGLRMPLGIFRWRLVKDGYETRHSASRVGNADRSFTPVIDPEDASAHLRFVLDPAGSSPGMVAVEAGSSIRTVPLARAGFTDVSFERYLIGRTEVTNREFEEFVAAGGYSDPRGGGSPSFSTVASSASRRRWSDCAIPPAVPVQPSGCSAPIRRARTPIRWAA